MQELHARFTDSMTLGVAGITVTVIDLLKGGTIVVGLVGAIFAAMGGYEAWRAKRLERRMRELEIVRLEAQAPGHERNG